MTYKQHVQFKFALKIHALGHASISKTVLSSRNCLFSDTQLVCIYLFRLP